MISILPTSFAYQKDDGLSVTQTHEDSNIIVSIENGIDSKAEMIQFCLIYDDACLNLETVANGNALSGNLAPTISSNTPGRIYFVWESLTPLKEGNLVSFTFQEKENVSGTTEIDFDLDYGIVFADHDFNELNHSLKKMNINLDQCGDGNSKTLSQDAKESESTNAVENVCTEKADSLYIGNSKEDKELNIGEEDIAEPELFDSKYEEDFLNGSGQPNSESQSSVAEMSETDTNHKKISIGFVLGLVVLLVIASLVLLIM